ncbi:hypothetical protein HMN09_00874000 [Mycena chlorophos]|uniref:Uncharacterized protein n=1 Tax=Mycena chlorophos TaxID=658473 RepID=A0A8H6W5E4_MYCCL|nr:hypothetical protein HMN09_00874000 [Mycena chlorophos]
MSSMSSSCWNALTAFLVMSLVDSSAAAAVPVLRPRERFPALESRQPVRGLGMEIADLVIIGVFLVTIPLAIALILRWRAGRLARSWTTVKEANLEDDTRTLRESETGSISERFRRTSWAWFLRRQSNGSDENPSSLERSYTSSTQALYISNQERRAQKKAAEIEGEAERKRQSAQTQSTARTSTMTVVGDSPSTSRPGSVMWGKENKVVPPMPPMPPPALVYKEAINGIDECGPSQPAAAARA